jgi:hypothetical protein
MNTNRKALENYLDEQRRRSDVQRRQAAEQGLRRDKAAARPATASTSTIADLEAEKERLEELSYAAGEETWDDIMDQIDEIDDEIATRNHDNLCGRDARR